jgi:hypothetical protein
MILKSRRGISLHPCPPSNNDDIRTLFSNPE